MLQPRADLQTIGQALILPTAQIKPQQCLQPRADLQTNGSVFILPTVQIKPQQCLQLRVYLQTNGSAFNSLTATFYEKNNFIQMSLTELRPTPSVTPQEPLQGHDGHFTPQTRRLKV